MKFRSVQRSTISIGVLVSAVLVLVLAVMVVIAGVSHAQNQSSDDKGRLITIHDQGLEKVIISQAETIGDAINEAGITVDERDFVEPALDEKLVASDYQVNIYRARPMIVVDGNVRHKVITPYQTAEQIVESVGIDLYPEDEAKVERADSLMDGTSTQLTIDRATAFSFTLYGKTSTARTQAVTVGEMLEEKGIEFTKEDRLSVNPDTKITEGLKVKLWREGKQVVTVEESVNFAVEKIENVDQPLGYRVVKTPGIKGKRSVTYEVTIRDGEVVKRKEIASLTLKAAKKQVEVVGVKGQYTTPSENETITWKYLTSHGFSRVQAAGIMGNLMQEHGFNTSGDGLAQWTGGRRAALYSRPYPTNIYTQLDFLLYELNTSYASVGNAIRSTSSLVTAVQIFQNQYERCGICMESNRIQYARNILASH